MTEYEAFALELAAEAARVTLPLFRNEAAAENKAGEGAFDPVTEADRGAEAAIRRMIAARYPDHGVIGEEYGEDRPDAEHVWVLDPVDGTRAFISGLPLWTTLIALRQAGRPTVGVIAQPYLDEVFLGGPSGARLVSRGGERAIRVRACPRLTEAVIATTDPDIFTPAEFGAWTQVRAAARLARFGCDAYAYAMVAMGRIDLVAETGLKEWDWSALVPVIEAAGGQVTDWTGQPPSGDGRIIAVGDARVREDALLALKRGVR
ncbi:inositol monophosphatase [Brevundimonas sp. AAP58]|uniref:histidinol-phosphatase n=1 Tax=Brevundimonas sp. AAP58 TaxID=1523422 RepID=UPI0006B9FFCB|nr:histidinol-phosphatase [Brevundimonas sp. AAP58]KPF81300.1 inositol monophosphatase [Brevundimonas sp. AAP58]